jgi:hypothetical protein
MYYLKPEHTQWVFDRDVIAKIFYIRVPTDSNEYDSAVKNSMIMESETSCCCDSELEQPK